MPQTLTVLMVTPPTSKADEPHGSPSRRRSGPNTASTPCVTAMPMPIVIMTSTKVGWPTTRRRTSAVQRRAAEREHDGGGEHREPEREPEVDREPRDRVGAEQQHRALREVDDAAGAVDDHEPERDERVGRAQRDALEEQLEELGHAASTSSTALAEVRADDPLVGLDLGRRADRDRHAEVEHEDAVGDLHDHPHVVLDEQHSELALAAQAAHERGDLGALGGVHAGDRLVEQHQPRLHRQAARQLDALAVAVGEQLHLGAGVVGEPDERERLGAAARWRRSSRAAEPEPAAQHAGAHQVMAADEHVLERRQVREDARGSGSCARRPGPRAGRGAGAGSRGRRAARCRRPARTRARAR